MNYRNPSLVLALSVGLLSGAMLVLALMANDLPAPLPAQGQIAALLELLVVALLSGAVVGVATLLLAKGIYLLWFGGVGKR